jgi:hypothetical protein
MVGHGEKHLDTSDNCMTMEIYTSENRILEKLLIVNTCYNVCLRVTIQRKADVRNSSCSHSNYFSVFDN